MKYTEPLDSGSRPELGGHYINAIPAQGIPGSIVPAGALEPTQREIVHAIEAAGMFPDGADFTQLAQAIGAIAYNNIYKTGDIRLHNGTPDTIPEGWAFLGYLALV